MNYPRVWDGSAYTRRLHPISCKIKQSLQPLSTVNMTLPAMDEITNLEWVEMPIPDGSVEYYRVASVATDAESGEKTVYLEHGACLLDDMIIPETGALRAMNLNGTARADATAILNYQSNSAFVKWHIGTVETDETIYIEPGDMSLMTALLTMMQTIPRYQLEFEQASATDWRVNIRLRGTEANPVQTFCEGRLSRNLKECDITYSTDGLCTRVYSEFLKAVTPGGVGYMDAGTVNQYGIHAETMSLNDNLTPEQKVTIIGTYLNVHGLPKVSVSISGVELSQVTGLQIDNFKVGKVCRIVIPWLGIIRDEVIVDKTYSDPYNFPESVQISLANSAPDLSIAIAAITGGGGVGGGGGGGFGSSGKGGKEAEKKRYETKFEQTDRYFRLLATDTEWDSLGNGTVQSYGQLVINSDAFQTVVNDERTKTNTAITQSADTINASVKSVKDELQSDITEQAGRIDLVVTKKDGKNVVNSAEIIAAINGDESSVLIDADKIGLAGYTVAGDFEVTGSLTGHLYGGVDATGEGEQVLANVGNFTQLYYNESVDMGDAFVSVTDGAYVDNVKTVTFTKANGGTAPITFSRAITSWDASGSGGTITVTAQPQNQSYTLVQSVKGVTISGGKLTASLTANVYKEEDGGELVTAQTVTLVEDTTNKKVQARLGGATGTAIAEIAITASVDEYESAGPITPVNGGGTVYIGAYPPNGTTYYVRAATPVYPAVNGTNARKGLVRYGKQELWFKQTSTQYGLAGNHYWYWSDTEQSEVQLYERGTAVYPIGTDNITISGSAYMYYAGTTRNDLYVKK